jgi:DNA-binding LytR/AlgR family response regulator
MPISCVAIDDEPLALELIKRYTAAFPALQLEQTFNDAIAALEYVRKNSVDLIFIDINMPDINGLDFVRSLQNKPIIVFTTAYRKFAADSYDLDALDYLLKPIEKERFAKAVTKAVEYYKYKHAVERKESEALFVRSEYQLVKIYFSDIEYIESVEDYLKIHVSQGKPVMTLMTLKSILEKLPANQFQRIHRSYIVPLSKVKAVVNRKVRLPHTELPIGDSYTHFIQEWAKR